MVNMTRTRTVIPFRACLCYTFPMDNKRFLQFYADTPKFTHEPGLTVMRELMRRLGDPQEGMSFVHIAGTNGKGSTAAMTAAILRAAGRRTGLYTSPDLTGIWERIQVNGVYINLPDLERLTLRVRRACRGLPEPSFFEKITAAAFLYFAEAGCDAVVLETGLGGRCDGTNIIKNPRCSVITPIGYDHTAVLGSTLSAIAREKAGIIKPGCPAVSAPQEPKALAALQEAAAHQESPFHLVDITGISISSRSPMGQTFSYGDMRDIRLPLLGDHQAVNAACAIETARLLGVEENAIREGLKSAVWPCRFEYFDLEPPILLDGAHNAHGAAALAKGLKSYFPGQKFTMLMGVMADKDIAGILALMEAPAARFICLAPDYDRALSPEALAGMIRTAPAETAASPEDALEKARGYEDPICAFGSLYYIGYLRNLIAKEN